MAEKVENIRVIMDKILRHPLMLDLTLELAIDYTVDFIRIVGCPNMFEEKTLTLEVQNYKALLPDDYSSMILVRCKDGMFRYSGETFHMSSSRDTENTELTYKIQGNYIFTSLKEGEIEIAYLAIATDTLGYPTIPDNSSFTRALELYIKKQWFTVLFEMGKLHGNILLNVLQEYAWAVGDCQTEFNRLSLDKAESFFNSWRTLLVRDREHDHGFKHTGTKEYIRRH